MRTFKVIYVTTGRVNNDHSIYFPPLVKNQIKSLHPFVSDPRIVIISSINPLFLLRKVMELRSIGDRYELIHAQYGAMTSFIAFLGKKDRPLVVSFGGSDLLGSAGRGLKWTLRNWITRQLGLLAASRSSKIIVKAEHLMKLLPGGLRRKAIIIPNGVNLDIFYPRDKNEARAKLGWDFEQYYVLFTPSKANNVIVKNLVLAKEVIEIVQEQLPSTKLELILDKSPVEVAEMMAAADCFLMTSKHEGSPNVIKEAMACDLPVVTVNVGDVHARLSSVKNCYVVNSYDANMLAAKLLEVLRRNQRSDGSEALRNQQLTAEEIRDKILTIYNEVTEYVRS